MRVIVAVVPLSGHVGPVSGLVAELVARGHEVRVYTGAQHVARFAELGARVVPWTAARDFDEDDLAAAFPKAAGSRLRTMVALVRDGFIGTAPGQVSDLQAELAREPADVLLADSMSFGGQLTGELTGMPWALVNVLPFNQQADGPPLGFPVQPWSGAVGRVRDRLLWSVYRLATTPFQRAYQRARRQVGLSASRAPYGSNLMSPWLVLATGCPGLGGPESDLLEQVRYVGRLPPAGVSLPTTQRRAATRPLVLVTQGTHDIEPDELIGPALSGLADSDVEVLATLGRRGLSDAGVPVPTNARVVDVIDFGSVLPETAVYVTNGGWGGVLAALAAGVPVIVAPGTAADKPEVARLVARSGAGIDLRRRRASGPAVADAVRRVLTDPRYAERAAAIGAELAAHGGVQRAVDLVETLATTREPIRRAEY
jgi:UDP:flavonoid glycosyltransferase YjiC (YdhE family)